MDQKEFTRYIRTLRSSEKRLMDVVASDLSAIKPTGQLGLKPLPALWYENDAGEKYIPDFTMNEPDFPPPGIFKYAHVRFPNELLHHVYKCREDGGYGGDDKIMSMGTNYSKFTEDLALRVMTNEGMRLSDAIAVACTACERCMNVLAHKYGMEDGYAADSDDAAKAGTHCELCAQIDPEYDRRIRENENPNPKVVEASYIAPESVLRESATRFLSHTASLGNDEIERVAYMEPDSFMRMLTKHSVMSELASLNPLERQQFDGYVNKLHGLLTRNPSVEAAHSYLNRLSKNVTTASDDVHRQTDSFIRYMTLSGLSTPERMTLDVLQPLRSDCNAFTKRFRYTKAGTVQELARQTLFKFEKPAAVLGYQQTLLVNLSHFILNKGEDNLHLVKSNLKYLGDRDLYALIS